MNQELINDENLGMLRKWICDIMNEADFGEDEFDLVDLCAYGSRTTGRAYVDSDLDILLEYKGSAREDAVFNVLHDTPIYIRGRARARLSAVPTGPVQEVNSGTGLSLCLKARARVHAVDIEKKLWFL